MTLAEAVAQGLRQLGIEHAFGIPGIHNLALHKAFIQQGIKVVTTRHEQGAAFMCDGYARVSGRPAVCLVIDGPGLLNAATGIAQANSDSSPLIVVTPAPNLKGKGTTSGHVHELPDQSRVSSQICREFFEVCSSSDLAYALKRIDFRFSASRPGAAHLQVPMDLMMSQAVVPEPSTQRSALKLPADAGPAISEAERMLNDSQRPLVLAGGGTLDAGSEVARICDTLDAPCLNTTASKGLLPESNPYRVGGSPSLPCIRNAMKEADVLLAIGTEFGETDFDLLFIPEPVTANKLIRVDIDPHQLKKNINADVAICCDAKTALKALHPCPKQCGGVRWSEALRCTIRNEHHFHPDYETFFNAVRKTTDVLVGDSTQPSYYATWMYEPEHIRSCFHSATGFGTLGFGLPAAIGAKIARPDARVTSLIGDGGAQFTISELAVATDLGLGMPFLIWDNSSYREIDKALAVDNILKHTGYRQSPDFRMIANAFGCAYAQPESYDELTMEIARAHDHAIPTVIAVEEARFIKIPQPNWYL